MPNFDHIMRNRVITLLMIWATASTLLTAQTAMQFMTADGISDNNVLCGLRDQYGFVWLGTNNGLNCFDGTQNTIYRNMVEENASFENNTITALYEHGSDIWFGGSFGLYVYHRSTNTFSRFNKKTKYGVVISATVQNIVRGQDGKIWIGTLGQGLFIYDPTTEELTQDSRHGSFISDVLALSDSPVFVASMQGDIYTFGSDGTMMKHFTIPDFVSDKNKICLAALDFTLYIGCGRGLFQVHRGEQTVVPVASTPVHALLAKGSELLVGTDNGIFVYSPATGQMQLYNDEGTAAPQPGRHQGRAIASPTSHEGPATLKINAMTWDRDSTLWVMTEMGGVLYLPMTRKDVGVVHLPETGQSQMIRAICEAPDGRLWIGSDSGLGRYDPATGIISPMGINEEIITLMLDGDDLWMGTRHNGIIVLNTTSGQKRDYRYSNDRSYTVPSNEITSLLRTSKGDIYVGTSWGLCRFERQTENFMWYFEIGSQTHITSLAEDKQGCVWAATSNHGLFRQWEPGSSFRNFVYNNRQPQVLSSNDVSTVFCDHQGDVWVATTDGTLSRYLPDEEGFERIDTQINYLQDQPIYFIVEDLSHNLWLGLETGILRLGLERRNDQAYLLQSNKDLSREPKPHNSAFVASNGQLYVGRYNDLVFFFPDRINFSLDKMPVYITSITFPFRSTEKTKNLSPQTSAEENSFNGQRPTTITLPYADNSFTLHFAAPHLMGRVAEQRFEYMLQGIDRDWARGTKNAEATYANIPPGTYEFLLRKAGNTNADTYARLHITILPPWYRTTLAYIIYALLVAAAVVWTQRRYSNKLRHRYARRMKEYQTQQEKANFESKIRFFINLVHEIRTPLTLMSLPLEAIEESLTTTRRPSRPSRPTPSPSMEGERPTPNPSLEGGEHIDLPSGLSAAELTAPLPGGRGKGEGLQHIAAIRRNMNYLLGITNQLLDFQKAEHGKMQIHLSSCNVNELLTGIYEQFADAIEVQGKRIQLQLPDEPVVTALDVDKVQKVMMNLVGNANKYARSEIIIRLESLSEEPEAKSKAASTHPSSLSNLRISVIDDGPGVPPSDHDKIFDLYYQIGNDSVAATLGTGLGLSYAKMLAEAHDGDLLLSDSVGGGSNFQLILPIKAGTGPTPNPSLEGGEHIDLPSGLSAAELTAPLPAGRGKGEGPLYTILLVEDNEELLQMTANALRQYFRVLKARDGQEALDVLPYNDIDVIVSDVMMPRIDGIELCKRIKDDVNYSHIPVILLTAKTTVEAKLEGMQNGADIYLEKPFSIRQLHLQIMSLLRMRQNFHERMKQINGTAAVDTNDGELGLSQQDILFMERLQQMVADNMRDEEFSIDQLAEQMNMSRSSFYRKIKALTDLTPIEYLKMRRLEQAATLLRQGLRITEVAERVGFTSSSYFAKCFKARFGVLPKDFVAR